MHGRWVPERPELHTRVIRVQSSRSRLCRHASRARRLAFLMGTATGADHRAALRATCHRLPAPPAEAGIAAPADIGRARFWRRLAQLVNPRLPNGAGHGGPFGARRCQFVGGAKYGRGELLGVCRSEQIRLAMHQLDGKVVHELGKPRAWLLKLFRCRRCAGNVHEILTSLPGPCAPSILVQRYGRIVASDARATHSPPRRPGTRPGGGVSTRPRPKLARRSATGLNPHMAGAFSVGWSRCSAIAGR